MALLLLGYLGLAGWMQWKIRSCLGPGGYRNAKAVLDSTVEVPAEYQHPAPFDPGFLDLARQLTSEFQTVRSTWPTVGDRKGARSPEVAYKNSGDLVSDCLKKLSYEGEELTPDEWALLQNWHARHARFHELTSQLARHPHYDYDLGWAVEPDMVQDFDDAIGFAIYHQQRLPAFLLDRDGRTSEAISHVLEGLGLARVRPGGSLLSRLQRVALITLSSRLLTKFSVRCEEADTLTSALIATSPEQVGRVSFTMLPAKDLMLLELLAPYARAGYPMHFEQRRTVREMFDLFVDVPRNHLQHLGATLPPNHPRYNWITSMLAGMGSSDYKRDFLQKGPLRWLPALADPIRIYTLSTINVPNRTEAETRGLVAEAWLRLCRIQLRERLAALRPETAPPLPAADDLRDPFSTGTLTCGPGTGRHYSIGPDRTDDHAGFPFDPTNGTLSAGDIYFQ